MSNQTVATSMRSTTPAPAPSSEVLEAPKPLACRACSADLEKSFDFCPKCAFPVAENRGLAITDDELESFLFNGYVARTFESFGGKLKFGLRTLQAGDYNKIQRHMGEYSGGRRTTQGDHANEERLVTMAHALTSWMGAEMDDTDKARGHLETIAEGVMEILQDRFNRLLIGVDQQIKNEVRLKNS